MAPGTDIGVLALLDGATFTTGSCGITHPAVLLAEADEPRGGWIKLLIGIAILAAALAYSVWRLRRRRDAPAARSGLRRLGGPLGNGLACRPWGSRRCSSSVPARWGPASRRSWQRRDGACSSTTALREPSAKAWRRSPRAWRGSRRRVAPTRPRCSRVSSRSTSSPLPS